MTYIVGIDLRDSRSGVIRFASWLRRQGACEGLLGVHVVESDADTNEDGGLLSRAREALESVLAEAGVAKDFDELVAIDAGSVETKLHALCIERATAGVILGRRAGRDEQGFVRLGATTRRLLRTLPAPVIVVPPDLDPSLLGAGPVLVAVATEEEASLAGFRFGSELAQAMKRDIELVRVVPGWHGGSAYVPVERAAEQRERRRLEKERELLQWMKRQGIEANVRVLSGSPLECLVSRAREAGAPLIVCGRSKATAVEQFLGGSTAADVAAFSRVPTAVVAAGT